MNRKKILNITLVLLIGIIAAFGILYAGNLRGWFGESALEESAYVTELSGSVCVERSGIGLSMTEGSSLRDEDILETRSGSAVTIAAGGNRIVFNENTEVRVISSSAGALKIEILSGEVFVEINDSSAFGGISVNGSFVSSSGTVYSVNVRTGSWSIYVFEGTVEAAGKTAEAGSVINVVNGFSGTAPLAAAGLNEFNIENAKAASAEHDICFTTAELDKVVSDREEEKRLALEEQAAHDAMILAQGGTVAVATTTTSSSPVPGGSSPAANLHTCTIQIRCDTILDNMDKLTSGKNAYVPASGVILATSSVQFVEGETVFEVLQRACSYAGIQLEYSWTPMYGSYYIEGINNLYEFDCGAESGWMYKVNGWFPNYGCSSYTLKDGDVIVWCYTCSGLGADVGGSVY
ncbi:MAG: DUF4430 domain-containing protein [Eubacteriaceae bacterium]|nr:DUF4430 domain-containing protein [Eubacteriaceae bacterium]